VLFVTTMVLSAFLAVLLALLLTPAPVDTGTTGDQTAETVGTDMPDTATESTPTPNPPATVRTVVPTAVSFYEAVNPYYSADMFIRTDGTIVLEYASTASTGGELESEVTQIALLYTDHIDDPNNATALVVVTNGVEFVVPQAAVERYTRGKLDDDAFAETIGVLERGDE